MNTPDMATYMANLGRAARHASHDMARASTATKNRALQQLAHEIDRNRSLVLTANGQDLASAHSAGLDSAFIDRLTLTPERIDAMVEGLAQIIALPDPVGEISELRQRPSGIQVGRMRVPLGVIGIIYESRPNVTVDAAALCLKAGNAAILRGGSEAIHSNRTLAALMSESLARTGLPPSAVQLVSMTDRAAVDYLIRDRESVDVIIPRGGRSLIEHISTCLLYTSDAVLPRLGSIYRMKQVELRVDEHGARLLQEAQIDSVPATEDDWRTEYLAPILAIRVVKSLDEAIAHINEYGSHHTDSIITQNHAHGMRFLREVDSASVMINASTRFADGFEYGLGAEIGISTDKLHARGPVGLEGLTSQKYVVFGHGEIRT